MPISAAVATTKSYLTKHECLRHYSEHGGSTQVHHALHRKQMRQCPTEPLQRHIMEHADRFLYRRLDPVVVPIVEPKGSHHLWHTLVAALSSVWLGWSIASRCLWTREAHCIRVYECQAWYATLAPAP